MIITVFCPLCEKKIQIDNSNDANICVCCGKAFITSNAKLVDNNNAIALEDHKQNNTSADMYFNNIVGLLEKGTEHSNESLVYNLNKFKNEYPLDERIDVCDYLIAYNNYLKANEKSFTLIHDLLLKLSKIKKTEFYGRYYAILLKEANTLTNTSSAEMLNIKLYFGNFDLKALKNDITSYKTAFKKYRQSLTSCEASVRTFESNLDKHGTAVRRFLTKNEISIPHDFYLTSPRINPLKIDENAGFSNQESEINRYAKELDSAINKLFFYEKRLNSYRSYSYADFPVKPICAVPILPIRPTLNTTWLSYLKDMCPSLQTEEYGIDADYLYAQYKLLNSAGLSEYIEVKNTISKLFSLLPQDIKNEINEEERKRKEQIKKQKEEKILKEIEMYWANYLSVVKSQGAKAGYNYLTQSHKIENKIVYNQQELSNYKKGLFGVKYLSDINKFTIEDNTSLTYKKMNFTL